MLVGLIVLGASLAALSADSPAARATTPAQSTPAGPTTDEQDGGTHLRVSTPHGPVHLFRPRGYDARTAGIVIYVHGYYVDVDEAWRAHRLPAQFVASGRNALFVAPEAPSGADEKPNWGRLQQLLNLTLRRARWQRPRGAVVVAGHSGAFRTIVPWLKEPFWHHLILIDGLYGREDDFGAWLRRSQSNRMTLVVRGTAKWAEPFVRSRRYAITVARIPDALEELSRRERTARLLALRSQFGHFELITDGRVLPLLLRRTPLSAVPALPALPPRR